MDPEFAQGAWSDRRVVHFDSAAGTSYEPARVEAAPARPGYVFPRPRLRIRVRRRK